MSQRLTGTVLETKRRKVGWLSQKQKNIRIAALTSALAMFFNIVAPISIVAAETASSATTHDNAISAAETKSALGSVPGLLSASDQVAAKSDGDSAATTNINGTVVDVPKDAEQGVTFGAASGTKLDIALPSAEEAGTAKQVAPGVVGYDSGNGSTNAIQPTEDGGVRMLTVIDNPNAPTEYDYKVTVPHGGHIELSADGGALVLGDGEEVISSVATPWAKDAVGKAIETYFTTDGQKLTQHVLHNVSGVVYPVTADPWWKPWTWSIVKKVRSVSSSLWRNQKYRREFLVSLGCSLASAASIGALWTGAGAPASVIIVVAVGTYGSCSIGYRL